MREETKKLILELDELFCDKNSNFYDAYVACLSIASAMAHTAGVNQKEFIDDCVQIYDKANVKASSSLIN